MEKKFLNLDGANNSRFMITSSVQCNVSVPYTHPFTNHAAVCTCVYNGRYSRTSSRRERTPSRINGIRKVLQKDVDCSGKDLSTDWTCI